MAQACRPSSAWARRTENAAAPARAAPHSVGAWRESVATRPRKSARSGRWKSRLEGRQRQRWAWQQFSGERKMRALRKPSMPCAGRVRRKRASGFAWCRRIGTMARATAPLCCAAPSAVFDAICDIKPRLFGPGRVANPRDTTRYRCGLRLAQTKNPSVLLVASSIKHCTSGIRHCFSLHSLP